VAFAAGALIGDRSQLAHLTGSEQSARNLGADHLDAILALSIDPAAKAIRPKLVGCQLPGEERLSLSTEKFDVLSNGAIVLLFKELLVRKNVRCSHTLIPYRDYTTSFAGKLAPHVSMIIAPGGAGGAGNSSDT